MEIIIKMAINVQLVTNTVNRITYSTNNSPIVIRNDAFVASATKLAGLGDVSLANTSDGTTLIYNSANSTFVLESPDNLIIHNLDGGSF